MYPHATVVAADKTLDRLKAVRTSIELEQLRSASRLAAVGFRAAEQLIEAGRIEIEIAAECEAAFNRVACDGFERGRGYFFCMSGPNSAKAAGSYARTRNRRIENGDLVMIHANTVGDGTWTDITRTYIAGEPSKRQRHMQDAVREAREAALNAVVPGANASAVDAAARDVLTRHGFGAQFVHAVGHGVGFAAADANAMPRLHPKSPDILEAGMTFNIEPAVYFKGEGGLRHCDVVACTESGAEVLTSF
jgi:Xaa-Pro dipeptidase